MSPIQSLALIILVITVVINALLGVVIFRSNPKSKTNILFAYLSWVTAAWLVVNYLSVRPEFGKESLIFMRASIFFAVPQIVLVYLLAKTIPHTRLQLPKKKFYIILLVSGLVMLVNLSPFAFTRVELGNDVVRPIPGPGLVPFVLFALYFSVGTFFVFLKRYRETSGTEKKQIRYFMMGILIMFALIIITILIPVALFNNNLFVPFSPLYTIVFLGTTFYAIVKFELFDLKVIATQALTLIIWIILFAKIFVSQDLSTFIVDTLIFLTMVFFGILLIRSVVREIQQREQLERLNKRLKELDEQKNTFISMAAHELRAPMTAIKGYISMVMEGDTGDIPEKARGYLADANAINERLVRLVNNMLNVSRIEEGRMVFQEEEENLSRVLRSVYSQFAPEAERKDLDYDLEIPSKIKDKVKVDPDRVQEVVGNLISNAIKYTDKGFVKAKMSQSKDDGKVRVEIVDSGPGISKDEQSKLFQKFSRAESHVGKTTGTGLGLYISKLLVEKFGGEIGLDSEPGKGSNFWFELPLVDGNGSKSKDSF